MNDLDELLVESIITNTPLIIVEGKGDVKFYENLCAELPNKDFQVLPVEYFEGYSEGCESVIKAVSDLQDKFSERPENVQYVLGIIDRDVRGFRGELPKDLLGLFVLKYYSYETHFVSRRNLGKLVSHITNVHENNLNEQTLRYLESDLDFRYGELFVISLEALNTACNPDYVSIIGYDAEPGRIVNSLSRSNLMDQLSAKSDELFIFAESLGVKLSDLPLIAKGKWYLHTFCDSILAKIKGIFGKCKGKEIYQCPYCLIDQPQNCLWKLNMNLGTGDLANYILNFIDVEEVDYIISELSRLGKSTDYTPSPTNVELVL